MISRRSFVLSSAVLAAPAIARAATEPFTLLLDWFVNPDHAPLFAAKTCGAFARAGLAVTMTAPTDPDVPPRLVGAGKADACLSYQPQLYQFVDKGLPVKRVATLINQPLDTLTALGESGIKTIADLKGRKIGYSVEGFETVLIGTMLKSAGLTLGDVTLVNVNFNLVTALQAKEVDAVIGTYRTYEDIQLAQDGLAPVIFAPEDYGVPRSDELIVLANDKSVGGDKMRRFVAALGEGVAALKSDPRAMLAGFLKDNPSLNDKLDLASWGALVPGCFAPEPGALDAAKYRRYRDFMHANGLIARALPLDDYAVATKA
ncbi:ABC transporter substrate-binding protein [Acidocella sp.]|uniref:ABC transporter substrate-binding protein n=1 Tax=Acidocella sp. TaxID=50710 RepID=UPI002608FD9F|nr:ABC transporter substrate-binding protein [Acidocella sp.]